MKHPKLKRTVLCQILLYLPTLSFILWIAAVIILADKWQGNEPLLIGAFFLISGVALWYLIHNFFLLISADCLFSMIRQWKKDRAEYCTYCNGNSRTEIYKTIKQRCKLWGKHFESTTGHTADVEVYYRHEISWTIYWSAIEKRLAICTTDVLTEEQYRLLTEQAQKQLRAVPNGKIRFKSKDERKAPRAKAYVIIIFADMVEDEVKELARKPLKKSDDLCILPCVIQCSNGCYYTKCTADYYEQGMMSRPAGNFAAGMIRKLVFKHRLPKDNADTQPEPTFDADIEMSLWEYCKSVRDEVKDVDEELKKDRIKAFRRMRNGEVCIDDGIIRYKQDDRLAEFAIMPDDEDETLITLIPDPIWYCKLDNGILPAGLYRDGLKTRKMKKGEQEQTQKYMEAKLVVEGYRIAKS